MSQTNYCEGNHILVGLGGTGGKVLKAFKMRMFEEFKTAEERAKVPVSLLYVDSTREMMPVDGKARPDFRVMGQDASFTESEFCYIKGVDVQAILSDIRNYPNLQGIVGNVSAVSQAIGNLGEAAGQKRRAGRLLFAANVGNYLAALASAFNKCRHASGKAEPTTIHIFAGLAGGTGSGSIIDALVQTRKAYPNYKILVYVMLPEMNLPDPGMDKGRYYQNGYAAMNELNALQAGRFNPCDVQEGGTTDVYSPEIKGVANGIMVYSNENENGLSIGSFDELPKTVSDFIFARIFLINRDNKVNEDMLRAVSYENGDDFALEYDEAGFPNADGQLPVARTKKVSSFGIKRVMYPELRVLKHITYSLGESVLYHFKYNNWRDSMGFVNEAPNRDYNADFLNADNLKKWRIDLSHLCYEERILPNDPQTEPFKQYWNGQVDLYAGDFAKSDNPLNELDNYILSIFDNHFREVGVNKYFTEKTKAIPEIAKEVRSGIEKDFFAMWRDGRISVVELQEISSRLLAKMGEIQEAIETSIKETQQKLKELDDERTMNVREWRDVGIIRTVIGKRRDFYVNHQEILKDLYEAKTRLVALEFAKSLAARTYIVLTEMDKDISTFATIITKAIEESERMVTAQGDLDSDLNNMQGAVVMVSEEKKMLEFERTMRIDRDSMKGMGQQLREAILPKSEFTDFGRLAEKISVDSIKDAFDIKLSVIVEQRHAERLDGQKQVLGLNILSQLRQKLDTDEAIASFASKIVSQSGVYLHLNKSQLNKSLRNNEDNLAPTNPASINQRSILISIPSPDKDETLQRFAEQLKDAFRNCVGNMGQTTINVNMDSPRKNELSIITVSYLYPMRAIDWLATYKRRYERILNTPNPATNRNNAILLHSEGDGTQLPRLFALGNDELQKALDEHERTIKDTNTGTTPPPPGPGTPPPPPVADTLKVYIFAGGVQTGPIGMEQCKQMVAAGQLTPQTQVWMDGMAGWAPASTVQQLSPLFAAPAPPPPMPDIQLYASIGGTQTGPLGMAQCKQMAAMGQLTPQTMVWMAGMPAWAPAATVQQLASIFAAPTPPMPQVPPMPPSGAPTPPPMA